MQEFAAATLHLLRDPPLQRKKARRPRNHDIENVKKLKPKASLMDKLQAQIDQVHIHARTHARTQVHTQARMHAEAAGIGRSGGAYTHVHTRAREHTHKPQVHVCASTRQSMRTMHARAPAQAVDASSRELGRNWGRTAPQDVRPLFIGPKGCVGSIDA